MLLNGVCVSFSSISLAFQKETIGNLINSLTSRPVNSVLSSVTVIKYHYRERARSMTKVVLRERKRL